MKAAVRSRPAPHDSVFLKPLGLLDQRFLFMLRDVAGGSMPLIRLYDRQRAKACEDAGYCQIGVTRTGERVHLKDSGRRYLKAILRAE